MPTREEIMKFMAKHLARMVRTPADIWVALYILLLDYVGNVPRITDANRFKPGKKKAERIWFERAKYVEQALARALGCPPADVKNHVDFFMREMYPPNTQRMNPIGIALACAAVHLIDRFAGNYRWQMEAPIGIDIFPNLTNFRRKAVDIVAFQPNTNTPYAVVSSKWGIRHDRIRDPQEEADTYKQHEPALKFYVLTNEFDNGRLQHVLNYLPLTESFTSTKTWCGRRMEGIRLAWLTSKTSRIYSRSSHSYAKRGYAETGTTPRAA